MPSDAATVLPQHSTHKNERTATRLFLHAQPVDTLDAIIQEGVLLAE